jgi:outer membrane protein assembly factor BamA
MRCGPALVALWLLAGAVAAQEPAGGAAAPTIASIDFAGNDTTQPQVMLREMVIKPGDPADPAKIERSRQGVQDLGLFRSVEVRQTPVAGGVALTFVVDEKWYILPIPRLDANSEGENAYGLSMRWYNVFGLNHTLRGNWTRRDEEKANKGESTSYSVGYSLPFVYDSPWGVGFVVGHSETPIVDYRATPESVPIEYTELSDSAGVSLSRSFATGPASQGWSTGVSLGWSRQDTEGPGAPVPYGHATVLGVSAGYKDVRYNLYSEDGVMYGGGVQGSSEGLGSEYSFAAVQASITRYIALGSTPHQNVNLFGALGSYHGGPIGHETSAGTYGLGGASRMRAYPADFVIGDFYYHLGAEYLRPLFADWLRPVVVLEVGDAFEDARNSNGRVYASLGVGLRVRLTFLVNVEVEAGVALPVGDGADVRFFASKV